MTHDWTSDDWHDAMLDLGHSYEQELESISVRSLTGLLAFLLGCVLGMLASYLVFASNSGLHPLLVGRVPDDISTLVFFSVTMLSCSMQPHIELVGYGTPSYGNSFFTAYCPGILFASTTLRPASLTGVAAIVSLAIVLVRITLLILEVLSEELGPLPSIVFGSRMELFRLADAEASPRSDRSVRPQRI